MIGNPFQNATFPSRVEKRVDYATTEPGSSNAALVNGAVSSGMQPNSEEGLPQDDPLKTQLDQRRSRRLVDLKRKMRSGINLNEDEIAEYMNLMHQNQIIDRGMVSPSVV